MQNEAAEEKAKATGLVGRLQEKIEALKEQARHMQRQMPKPKKKLRQPILNDGKQKPKYKMPPLTAISQPEKAKVAQMEVPRSNNNNRTKRNRRNRRRRQQKKRMSNLKKRNYICGEDRNKIQNTFLTANSWAHAHPRPYQTANQNLDRNGYFCNTRCTCSRSGQRETKPQLCNRFAEADVPGNCTITYIKTGWVHSPDRSRKWVYTLQATPLNSTAKCKQLQILTTKTNVW